MSTARINTLVIVVIVAVNAALVYWYFINDRGEVEGRTSQTSIVEFNTADSPDRKHSIPLEEILSGGVPKDGIPSIDNPVFVTADSADFLDEESVGLGLSYKGVDRFYPYRILVLHEIVNDEVADDPLLVTYCPLCATAVVFDPVVDGVAYEFGVSGLLWQSNLLMYNRTENLEDESLWSQVLGRAVVGPATGAELKIIPSNTVSWEAWREAHPDTEVLSENTGTNRNYGYDPYLEYYTDDTVSFGATFDDDRAHPKAFVYGVELGGETVAYDLALLAVGETVTDVVGGQTLSITVNESGEVSIVDEDGAEVRVIAGFWFSWLAAHPETNYWTPSL